MIATWSANALTKIVPSTVPSDTTGAVLRLSAARGEIEAVQLAMHADTAIRVDAVNAGPVTLNGRSIPLQARVVDYVNVSEPSHGDGEPGIHPDILRPFGPFDFKGTRSLWIDVEVPRDAAAGLYKGEIRVETSVETVAATVELTVYDFELPFPQKLVTAFGLYEKPLRDRYGDRYEAMLRLFRDNLRAHRVTHLAFPATDIPAPGIAVGPDNSVKLDYTEFDRAVEDNLKHGMNAMEVPLPARYDKKTRKLDSPYDMPTFEKIVSDIERHLIERGWADFSYFFLVDEPGKDDITPFETLQKQLRRAAPRLRRRLDMGYGAYGGKPGAVREALYRRLAGLVEIWVPHIDCIDQEFLESEQAKGNEAWWYICCSAKHPYPNCLVDYPLLDSRVPFWMMFDAGATGYAYWTVDWWNEDPFTNPRSYDGVNGDGMLVYPGENGPIDSIRWEATRDGFEDYEYLALLAERIREAERAGRNDDAVRAGREALANVKKVAGSTTSYALDPDILLAARDKVARAIEGIGGKKAESWKR